MTVELLPPGVRPNLLGQSPFGWPALIDSQVHPVKVAVIEALQWVGGPLSAREIWLMGTGELEYGTVAYHVKALLKLGHITPTAMSPVRGSLEKFYVLTHAT
jgi:hypothetical protein